MQNLFQYYALINHEVVSGKTGVSFILGAVEMSDQATEQRIMTVLGSIDPSDLGSCTMHDHVLSVMDPFFRSKITNEEISQLPIDTSKPMGLEELFYLNQLGMRTYSNDNWDLNDPVCMQKEVAYFKQRGGNAILETSAPGIRGNIKETKHIAEETGVHIIASTGLYVGVSWPEKYTQISDEDYKDYLRKELVSGVDDTDIRAGHIKVAIRSGEGDELKFFAASAAVSKELDVLLTAHTSRGTSPENRRKMLHLLLDSGIDPQKLLLCHMHFTFWQGDFVSYFRDPTSNRLDLSWAREVMDLGVHISIDCFGEQPGPWDTVRLAGLIELLNEGYADRMVIGNDVYMKAMTRAGGGFGYCGILDYVLPELRKYNIEESVIDQLMLKNPQRMLRSKTFHA